MISLINIINKRYEISSKQIVNWQTRELKKNKRFDERIFWIDRCDRKRLRYFWPLRRETMTHDSQRVFRKWVYYAPREFARNYNEPRTSAAPPPLFEIAAFDRAWMRIAHYPLPPIMAGSRWKLALLSTEIPRSRKAFLLLRILLAWTAILQTIGIRTIAEIVLPLLVEWIGRSVGK